MKSLLFRIIFVMGLLVFTWTASFTAFAQITSNTPRSIAWSPDGTMIATGNQDSTIQFWNSATGQIVSTLQPSQSGPTFTVAWKPGNNHVLASGGNEQPILIWDVTTQQPLLPINNLPHNSTTLT